jgi:stalled ribosome rescue protein Dom34
MKTKAGLWIDHKQAIVVTVGDKGEEIRRIASEVEKQLQRTGDSPMKGSYEAQQVPSDDSRQRAFTGQLNTYYDEVIASLREATAILILGPGEAKDELRKRLEEKNLGSRIVGVETVDKMTAKARAHFANNQWG